MGVRMIVLHHPWLKHYPANAEDMGTMHWAAAAAEGIDDASSNLSKTVSCCCCVQDASMEAFFYTIPGSFVSAPREQLLAADT